MTMDEGTLLRLDLVQQMLLVLSLFPLEVASQHSLSLKKKFIQKKFNNINIFKTLKYYTN